MTDDTPDLGLREFQRLIEKIYYQRDSERGLAATHMWFIEEVGELARSFLAGEAGSGEEANEFADCLAWLSTLASLRGIDLASALRSKYGDGCPRCGGTPCRCRHR